MYVEILTSCCAGATVLWAVALCTDPGCPRAGLCPLLPPQPSVQSLHAPLVRTARFVTHFFVVLLMGSDEFLLDKVPLKKKYVFQNYYLHGNTLQSPTWYMIDLCVWTIYLYALEACDGSRQFKRVFKGSVSLDK
jgi:hypothetical protein